MNSIKLIKFGISGLAIAAVLAGCNASSDNNITGAGGSSSTGGNNGTGGTSTGGTTGTGGTSSTGGTTGTGGVASTGGTTGTGGVSSTGGTVGTGGVTGGGGQTTGTGGAGGLSGGAGHPGGGTHGSAGISGSAGNSGSFALTSMDQADGAKFASKFTCAESPAETGQTTGSIGNGINPDLEWTNPPAGTMSFAITFLDMTLINANMPQYGNHWAIWNIPATVMSFPEGTKTLTGTLSTAKQSGSFLAPCALSLMNNMDDQYQFTIYALSVPSITVSTSGSAVANARTALMTAMTNGQVLATATLNGHAGLKGM